MKITLIQGHVLEALKKIPDNSIDCIVTSPPYWGLRKYPDSANVVWGGDPNCQHEWEVEETKRPNLSGGKDNDFAKEKLAIKGTENYKEQVDYHKRITTSSFCKKCGAWFGQLGLEPILELYVEHLLQVTAELKRVLKPSGVMFWNHGDSYIGSLQGFGDYKKLPAKCMAMQNYRLALKMIDEQGWILRNIIIWYKPNHLPESVKDRFAKAYEPIFMFVKSKKYFFNLDAVREPIKTSLNSFNYRVREAKKGYFEKLGVKASEEEMKKYDKEGKLIIKPEKGKPISKYPGWEEIKNDKNSELEVGGIGRFWSWQREVGKTESTYPLGKNPGDVWTIATQPFPEAHFAVFPEELVRRCIKAGCPENGVVLDPFVGSGTTLKVAIEERRNAIGIEIVEDYVEMAKRRINWGSPFIEWEFVKL